MARKDKAGIYVDAQYLFDALYKAQFEMPKNGYKHKNVINYKFARL